MTFLIRAIASVLLCATALPAFADKLQPNEASPSKSELLQWKENVLDKYKHVAYLNAEYLPIAEKNFLREVRECPAAFSITTEEGTVEGIIVRLLGARRNSEGTFEAGTVSHAFTKRYRAAEIR